MPGFIAVCSVSVIEKFHWMELNWQKTTLFNTIAIGIETVTIGREIKLISTDTKGREISKHWSELNEEVLEAVQREIVQCD